MGGDEQIARVDEGGGRRVGVRLHVWPFFIFAGLRFGSDERRRSAEAVGII